MLRPVGIAILTFMISFAAYSMPPHPDLLDKIERGIEPKPDTSSFERLNINKPPLNSPVKSFIESKSQNLSGGLKGAPVFGDFNLLVILVEFSDQTHIKEAGFFDNLMFGDGSIGSPTVRHYYSEMSYGGLNLTTVNTPSSLGWMSAPQTYAYYVGSDHGTSGSQDLVSTLVDMVDPFVDFSQYDNDGDGHVDGVVVVHAGAGYEYAGGANIWSHMSYISPKTLDGTVVDRYSIQPEYYVISVDMKIGVIAHELGHLFGLPDLYDYGYDSAGVGKWSIMATGSWNGTLGSHPAGFDAWCRKELGFSEPQVVVDDIPDAIIDDIKDGGTIYKIDTADPLEYFLIENRQQADYDQYIPGAGLFVWHVDERMNNNNDQSHYLVALEQADGELDLEYNRNEGDSQDPFCAGNNTKNFGQGTVPNSEIYGGNNSGLAIADISLSAPSMTADIYIDEPLDNTPPEIVDSSPEGILEAGTTETTVSVTTDENAVCKYATEPGTAYSNMGNQFATTGSTEHSFNVGGLSNGVSRSFYVRCMDIQGYANQADSLLSFEVEETPEDQIKPGSITDLSVLECGRYSCLLGWTATGDDDSSGRAFQYDLRYDVEPITAESWSTAIQIAEETAPLDTGNAEEMLVNGLDEITTYHFALRVSDEFLNWSDLSNIASGQTTDFETGNIHTEQEEGISVIGGCGYSIYSESKPGWMVIILLSLILSVFLKNYRSSHKWIRG